MPRKVKAPKPKRKPKLKQKQKQKQTVNVRVHIDQSTRATESKSKEPHYPTVINTYPLIQEQPRVPSVITNNTFTTPEEQSRNGFQNLPQAPRQTTADRISHRDAATGFEHESPLQTPEHSTRTGKHMGHIADDPVYTPSNFDDLVNIAFDSVYTPTNGNDDEMYAAYHTALTSFKQTPTKSPFGENPVRNHPPPSVRDRVDAIEARNHAAAINRRYLQPQYLNPTTNRYIFEDGQAWRNLIRDGYTKEELLRNRRI